MISIYGLKIRKLLYDSLAFNVWGMTNRWANANNVQTLTITNGDLLVSLIAWMHRKIMQIISNMINGAWICMPILFGRRIEWGSHCCKLRRGMPALEGLIHTVVATESRVSSSIANLAKGLRICRLIIGGVLWVAMSSTIISTTLTTASTMREGHNQSQNEHCEIKRCCQTKKRRIPSCHLL